MEKHRVLRDVTDLRAPSGKIRPGQFDPIDGHGSHVGPQQTDREIRQRALPRARRTGQSHCLARANRQTGVANHQPHRRVISEAYIPEF